MFRILVVDDVSCIKFDDVEGVDEAEESLAEIVDYLHNPEKYKEIGAIGKKRDGHIGGNDER